MKIAVVGLWHLGTVTAAGLAAEGHMVVAIDESSIVSNIEAGRLPVDEPGLSELIAVERARGGLIFADNASAAAGAELIWICYDTPVDDDDRPDIQFVVERVAKFLSAFPGMAVVAVSSQLPVGTIAELEQRFPGDRFSFASIPENLRLGSAIAYFRSPDRFVVGIRDKRARDTIQRAVGTFAQKVEFMGVESAEMTKHAINAFLATSVTFANELATVCERVGADARDVERGLKSDLRVGPKAYLRAGEAFAGGTLARDLNFLTLLSQRHGLTLQQIRATQASNESHRAWILQRVFEATGATPSRTALLGLVYKPGTDTLRGSTAVALARELSARGDRVIAFDPAIRSGNSDVGAYAELANSAEVALADADVAIVATAWPQFRDIPIDAFKRMRGRVIIDPSRFLEEKFAEVSDVSYVAFGRGTPANVPL